MCTANCRSFLDESRNTDLIRWSDDGDSFIVLDEDEFAKTLIPELFKHNNYASFVRQLNMYGFHKKVGLSDNSMRASERKNKNPSEYSNPFFKRGRPNLLWLIHKPKSTQTKGGNKGRGKSDDFDDDVDETFGRENSPVPNTQDPLDMGPGFPNRQQPLLTMGNMANRLPQDEMASLRTELRTVQENQKMIREMLKQTRAEHQQLYGQAKAFHDLHEKHDNSINAILTFLATVYNKNLAAGQTGTGDMFPGKIQAHEQPRGNVVDMGDEKEHTPQPFRRPQLLLEDGTMSPATPTDPSQFKRSSRRNMVSHQSPNQQMHSPAVQELSDYTPSNRSSESPQIRPDSTSAESRRPIPEADILRMMNNASSAQSNNISGQRSNASAPILDFPEALSHLQNSDGRSPLTPHQRQSMLQLMANEHSAATSPTTPTFSANNASNNTNTSNGNGTAALASSTNNALNDLAEGFNYTTDQLNTIHQSLRDQDARMAALQSTIAPLSPSGSIPGVNDGTAPFPNPSPPPGSGLGTGSGAAGGGSGGGNGGWGTDMWDIDQLFNSGDYFNDAAGGTMMGQGDGSGGDLPDFDFGSDLNEDGNGNGNSNDTNDNDGNDNAAVATPTEELTAAATAAGGGEGGGGKRLRSGNSGRN